MSPLIEAIERFEAAVPTGYYPPNRPDAVNELAAAEAALYERLCEWIESGGNDWKVWEDCDCLAQGCIDGIAHKGTVYMPGYSETGRPIVIVLRHFRVLHTSELDPVKWRDPPEALELQSGRWN
jgi:hypothetical protein